MALVVYFTAYYCPGSQSGIASVVRGLFLTAGLSSARVFAGLGTQNEHDRFRSVTECIFNQYYIKEKMISHRK